MIDLGSRDDVAICNVALTAPYFHLRQFLLVPDLVHEDTVHAHREESHIQGVEPSENGGDRRSAVESIVP